MTPTVIERVLTALAMGVGIAICKPKMTLGRRRHDNYCDRCDEFCEGYAGEQLDFPLDDLSPEATSSREKLRAMWNAEYRRFCIDCTVAVEAERENT